MYREHKDRRGRDKDQASRTLENKLVKGDGDGNPGTEIRGRDKVGRILTEVPLVGFRVESRTVTRRNPRRYSDYLEYVFKTL